MPIKLSPIEAGRKLAAKRYKEASVVFVAGSAVRGEGTAFSDLDLVVVYPKLKNAYRESFHFEGWPIEAFVHDPDTLKYFFEEFDRKSGIPALPQMVLEGLEFPHPSALSKQLKAFAKALLKAGPPRLKAAELRMRRYGISDLVDDLREPRNERELRASGVRLYEELSDFYLRFNKMWSGKGKSVSRSFKRNSPEMGEKFEKAFEILFKKSDTKPVINLAQEILKKAGGPLFDGFQRKAPATWKKSFGKIRK